MSGCRNLSHPAAAPRRCRSRLRLPHGSLTFCVGHRSARWQQPCSQGSLCASNRQAQSQGCQALGALSGTSPWKRRPEVREPAFPGPLPSHRGLPGHLVQARPPGPGAATATAAATCFGGPLQQNLPCSSSRESERGSSGRSQVGGFRRCPLSEWPHRRKGPAAGPGRGALGPGAEGRPAVRVEAVASLFN